MPRNRQGSRAGAIERARAYVESGAFERDLARRVAIKTESQMLPASLPRAAALSRGGDGAGLRSAWALPRASTTTRCPARGRCCSPRRIEDADAADRARLRPRRRHPRAGGPVDQGQGPVGDGARRRAAVRPRHRRQQGPAHHQHGGARGGDGRARRQARLQRQVHHRDGRGGGLQGPGRAGGRPQGGLRGRRAGRLRRAAREAGAADHDAGLPRRHQFRSRLRPARGRASLRQLGWADRQPRRRSWPCAGLHRRARGRAAGPGARGAGHVGKAVKACPGRRRDRRRRGRAAGGCLVGRAGSVRRPSASMPPTCSTCWPSRPARPDGR